MLSVKADPVEAELAGHGAFAELDTDQAPAIRSYEPWRKAAAEIVVVSSAVAGVGASTANPAMTAMADAAPRRR
jgi:hypothetical protein